jgi:transmembrane sensor
MQMDFSLFQRYIDGNCTSHENEQVAQWWKANPEEADAFLLQLWNMEQSAPQFKDEQQLVWEKLQSVLQQPTTQRRIIRMNSKMVWRVACSIVAVLLLCTGTYKLLSRKTPVATAWIRLENRGVHPKMIRLPDGTRVWLNTHSSFEYAADFNKTDRKTRLSGEAFFDVAQDAQKPFTVQTRVIITKVLGTTFNIDAYPMEASEHVALVSGKVDLRNPANAGEICVLTPGQMATWSADGSRISRDDINLEDVSGWIHEKLVLNQVNLRDACRRIEASTGIKVKLSQALSSKAATMKLTGEYDLSDVENIIQSICFIHQLRYVRNGNQYYLKP